MRYSDARSCKIGTGVVMVIGLAGLQISRAQTASPKPQVMPRAFVVKAAVNEVELPISVLNSGHRFVDHLPQSAFKIYENGVEQNITSFSVVQDQPVSIGILVDNSGSMEFKRGRVNVSAMNFVKASNANDEVFVVNFNDQFQLSTDFTHDTKKMEAALKSIKSSGGTALYDAVLSALDHLQQDGANRKKVLLLVTDGWDNSSKHNLTQVLQALSTPNGPAVFCIGLEDESDGDEAGRQRARHYMQEIAAASGGETYTLHSIADVDSTTDRLAHLIRSQYLVSYHSNSTDTGYRKIRVEVTDKADDILEARTREGYISNLDMAARAVADRAEELKNNGPNMCAPLPPTGGPEAAPAAAPLMTPPPPADLVPLPPPPPKFSFLLDSFHESLRQSQARMMAALAATPADKINFKAAPDGASLGELIMEVAKASRATCQEWTNAAVPVTPGAGTGKEYLQALLTDSFGFCLQASTSLGASHLMDPAASGRTQAEALLSLMNTWNSAYARQAYVLGVNGIALPVSNGTGDH